MQSFPIFIPVKQGLSFGAFSFTRPPFFHRLTDEGVASMFLRTVVADVESAKVFVSKNSIVDLDALQDILASIESSPVITLKKPTSNKLGGLSTKSILLQNCILHLHMVEEPDQFGPWKIYGVDKESR